MALFGEKYGDRVRMVEIGEFSRELCGGIHVKATGDIGLFAILSEGSAASGVRRIEAAAGWNAFQLAKGNRGRVRTIAEALKIPPAEVVAGVEKLQEALRDERKRREKAEMAALSGGPAASSDTVQVGSVTLWRRDFGEADPKLAATAIDDAAAGKPAQVTLGAVVKDGKPQFIAKVGAEAVAAGAHAGNLLREVAKIAGGGGGGRAEFATAGGRDASKVSEALAGAEALLREMLIPST
jgi:alanyl-tRNA synthetase